MPNNTQSITKDELRNYFHLPINEVAKRLGVCATVLKKICRKNGIPRWPHRKIRSLEKMIASLEKSVPKNKDDENRIKQEIATLKSKKEFIIENPAVLAIQPSNQQTVNNSTTTPTSSNVISNSLPQINLPKEEEFSSISFNLRTTKLLGIEGFMLQSLKSLYDDDFVDKITIRTID